MLNQTTPLEEQSKDDIRHFIEIERARAVDALHGIENSAQRLIGSGQEIITHPIHTLTDMVEPPRMVMERPWPAIGVAVAAGFGLGLLLQKRGKAQPLAASPLSSRTREWLVRFQNNVLDQFEGIAESALSSFTQRLRANFYEYLRSR